MTRPLLTSCVCAALLATPAAAGAQPAVFLEAVSEFTSAVEGTFGDEGARIVAAVEKMARALDRWDREIAAFEAQVASAPSAAGMRSTLARMYAERGRLTDAQRELDTASRLDPRRPDLHVLRGLVLEASGNRADAGEAFRTAWTLDATDPVNAYLTFRDAVRVGSATDAQRAHATLTGLYSGLLGDRTGVMRPPFPRVELFQGRPGEPPVLPIAAYATGYARLARRDYAGAVAEFRRASAADPLVVDAAGRSAAAKSAVAALRQGRLADARSLLENGEPIRSSEAHRLSGLIYWAGSEYDKSIEQLSMAIAARPRDDRSRLALARVLSSAGRYVDAERALEETTELLPDSALAWWWLGLAREQLKRFAGAQLAFERAAAGALTGRSQFHASIGRLAVNAGNFSGAVEAFTRAVDASPNDAAMHRLLAGALQQMDRTDEAVAELVAVVLIDPDDANAHARIGQIHLDGARLDEAAAALRRTLDLSPSHIQARYALATTLMRLGSTDAAEQELSRVAEAQRQQLADRRRSMSLDVLKEEAAVRTAEARHDRAAALWQQVLEREPGRASNHLGFAVALAEGGRMEAAIAQYEQAIAIGAAPEAYRQLAVLYDRVGRPLDAARARGMYEKAVREDQTTAR